MNRGSYESLFLFYYNAKYIINEFIFIYSKKIIYKSI